METATFTMPAELARLKFEEYREALKQKYDETDDELMRSFKALSEGTPVLDLVETLKLGGVDEKSYPKLAIIRASAETCYWQGNSDGGGIFSAMLMNRNQLSTSGHNAVIIPKRTFPLPFVDRYWQRQQAALPHIPPSLRPKGNLSGYHILWEAIWKPVPPVDPYLLKRLGPPGSMLYAVLAQWDLTDLERAVLRRHLN